MHDNEFSQNLHPTHPAGDLLARITEVQRRLDAECHALQAQVAHHENWHADLADDRALLQDPEQIQSQVALIDTMAQRLQALRRRLAARRHDASLLRSQSAVALASGGMGANTPALARLLAEAADTTAAAGVPSGSDSDIATATGWDSLPAFCRPGATSGIPRPAQIGPRGVLPRIFGGLGGALKLGAILSIVLVLLNTLGGGAFNQRFVGNARFATPASGSGLPQINGDSREFSAAGSVLLKLVFTATGGAVDIEALTRQTADRLRRMSP